MTPYDLLEVCAAQKAAFENGSNDITSQMRGVITKTLEPLVDLYMNVRPIFLAHNNAFLSLKSGPCECPLCESFFAIEASGASPHFLREDAPVAGKDGKYDSLQWQCDTATGLRRLTQDAGNPAQGDSESA